MDSVDWTVVGQALAVTLGVGCLVVAAVMWRNRVKAKYDPVFDRGPFDGLEFPDGHIEIDDKALRRMMKQTSAEMEETGEWWGYRWSK